MHRLSFESSGSSESLDKLCFIHIKSVRKVMSITFSEISLVIQS